jgi:ATP/maltotriose-dependent transcriptional regulator MalT
MADMAVSTSTFAANELGLVSNGPRRWTPSYESVAAKVGRPGKSDIWRASRAIVRARSALINMRLDDASRFVSHLKELVSRSSCNDLLHTVPILEASVLSLREEFAEARRVLLQLPAFHSDALSATLLRYLDWQLNEHGDCAAADTVDYLTSPVGGKAVCRIVSLCISAAIAFDRLQLTMSANLATEALQLARVRYGNRSPMSSLPATLLAQVAYEQGRLDEAEALLRPRLISIRASGTPACIARASVILARISLHRGQRGLALSILREAEGLGRARRWSRLISAASSEHVRTLAAIHSGEPKLPRARLTNAEGTSGGCIHISGAWDVWNRRELDMLARALVPTYRFVERFLQQACSAASSGRLEDSYAILIPCLRIGATRGLRMVFPDAGRVLPTLLERLYHALPKEDPTLSELRPYIATLLRATVPADSSTMDSTTAYRALSQREIGILQMIAHGMSNKRIAQALGITPETVKSHAKSIFFKLATRTRAQAVARAEAIGLLS